MEWNNDSRTYTETIDVKGENTLFKRLKKKVYAIWLILIGYPSVIYTNTHNKVINQYKKITVTYFAK